MALSIGTSHFVAQQSEKEHTGVVIFLHGACDTGPGVEAWTDFAMTIQQHTERDGFRFGHLKVIYPTAPKRKYSADRGRQHTVWFDWPGIDPSLTEDLDSINEICNKVCMLIEEVVKSGIPAKQVVLGGLSMGGVVALHVAYRFRRDIKGVFGLSTFLANESIVFKELEHKADHIPPLFQAHGESDQLIRHDWGRATHDKLSSLGVSVQFHSYRTLQHSMCREELVQLKQWITDILPESADS